MVAGWPVELDAHLARLAASVRRLYGFELPAGARALAEEEAQRAALGRLRLTVRPLAADLACEAHLQPLKRELLRPGPARPVALRSRQLPGGLGPHKWADRSLLGAGEEGAVPLLCDGEEVLEAAWANVFLLTGAVLSTPPLDGRILPGITRASLLEIAAGQRVEVDERRIVRDELLDAEEVLLTSSIRGAVPVAALDGESLAGSPTETGRLLGSALARRRQGDRPQPLATPTPAPE